MDSARTSPHEPTGTPRGEWYAVIADGVSALRIRSGFTIGEAADGSLAVNDRDPSRRWVEFRIDDSDVLWAEITVPGHSLAGADGRLRQSLQLEVGARLAMPNNTLHVSREIRLAPDPGPLIAFVADPPDEIEMEPPVATRREQPDERESLELRGDALAEHGDDEPEYREEEPQYREDDPGNREADAAPVGDARLQPPDAPGDRTGSRGPRVLDVIADLREQLGMHEPARGPDPEPSDLDRVPEPQRLTGMAPEPSRARLAAEPEWAARPDRSSSVGHPLPYDTPEPARPRQRRRPQVRRGTRSGIGTAMLGAGALILLAAIVLRGPEWLATIEVPDDAAAVREPAAEPPAAAPEPPAERPASRGAAGSGTDTLEVRASAPETGPGAVGVRTPTAAPTPPGSSATPASGPPAVGTPPSVAGPEQSSAADAAPPSNPPPAAESRSERADEVVFAPRLDLARSLIAEGEITTPPGNNAVDVLTDILRESPDQPQARALIARCADTLVADAVDYQQAGRTYEARNTLEEVLSFAPNHPEATRLWRDWVGTSP